MRKFKLKYKEDVQLYNLEFDCTDGSHTLYKNIDANRVYDICRLPGEKAIKYMQENKTRLHYFEMAYDMELGQGVKGKVIIIKVTN